MFKDEILEMIFSEKEMQKIPIGTQATACSIRTRTKYSTRVETTSNSGVFKLLGRIACAPDNRLNAINGNGTLVTTGGGD